MAKNEKDKQTTAHMTQHRKLKNKQHEYNIGIKLHCRMFDFTSIVLDLRYYINEDIHMRV